MADPSFAANQYLSQIGPTIQPYYDPYIQAGTKALGSYQQASGDQLAHPDQIYNQLGGTYQQSPGYQFEVDQATKSADHAAAAGGYAGAPRHQMTIANSIRGLASRDYQNYMQNVLGLRSQGLAGMQDISHLGYGASDKYAGTLASVLQNQAGAAYAGAQEANKAKSKKKFGILSAIGTVVGMIYGGPMGAAAGGALGSAGDSMLSGSDDSGGGSGGGFSGFSGYGGGSSGNATMQNATNMGVAQSNVPQVGQTI